MGGIIPMPQTCEKNSDLKGACHKIEIGRIWYQSKDLKKLEKRGCVPASANVHARLYEPKTLFTVLQIGSKFTRQAGRKFCRVFHERGENVFPPNRKSAKFSSRAFAEVKTYPRPSYFSRSIDRYRI